MQKKNKKNNGEQQDAHYLLTNFLLFAILLLCLMQEYSYKSRYIYDERDGSFRCFTVD